jgi:hypothetical protein
MPALHSIETARTARAMAGWYGDPTISWSVLLHAKLDSPAHPVGVGERLAAMVTHYPHLGPAPAVQTAGSADWPVIVASFANEPYIDGFPLVRVAVGTEEPRLAIAAHHCVTNGLGLLALLGAALDTTVTSTARGIGDRPSSTSSAMTRAKRLAEALLRPPARIARRGGDPTRTGDVLTDVELPATRLGTGELVAATARAVEWWNQRESSRGHHGRHVAGIEVSRRGGSRLSPELDSAFLRVPLPADPSGTTVRRTIAERPPEPVHPHTRPPEPVHPHTRSPEPVHQHTRPPGPVHQHTNSPEPVHPHTRSPEPVHQHTRSREPVHPHTRSPEPVHQHTRSREPVHPRTRPVAPRPVAEALARRLGPTFLVSNLGRAGAGTSVRSLAFHPTASGRSGIAIGAATAGAITTITIRARRSDFDDKAARELLDWVIEELELDV